MDITVSPLTVGDPGEPDNALDEVIAKRVECQISQDSPQEVTIVIAKDGYTRRFTLGAVNPQSEHRVSLLINCPPTCGYVSQPDDRDMMLQCHLPAGTVHLEHLSATSCYIGLFSDDLPADQDYGIIIANVSDGGTLRMSATAAPCTDRRPRNSHRTGNRTKPSGTVRTEPNLTIHAGAYYRSHLPSLPTDQAVHQPSCPTTGTPNEPAKSRHHAAPPPPPAHPAIKTKPLVEACANPQASRVNIPTIETASMLTPDQTAPTPPKTPRPSTSKRAKPARV